MLEASGLMSLARIVSLYNDASVTEATVSAMITKMIQEADKQIQDVLEFPILIKDEVHIADGENSEFDLGPEDEEHYSKFTVEDCLVEIIHCYFDCPLSANRRLHPYPRDCDDFITDSDGLWTLTTGGGVLPTENTDDVFSGDCSLEFVFTGDGTVTAILDKEIPIDQYEYVALAIKYVSGLVSEPTFTVTLTDKNGGEDSQTFTIDNQGAWYVIWIRIDNMTGNADWENYKLERVTISCDSAITFRMDMFNFNDGYCWSFPSGKLYIHEAENAGETPPVEGYRYYVTYRFDPYLVSTPYNVRKASKYLAASDLIEHLIGLRQSATAFEAQGDSGERIPDREALFTTHAYLKKIAEEAMASIGYGFDFSPVRG